MQILKLHISRFIILIVLLQLINLSVHAHPVNEVMLTNSYQDDNRIDNAVEYVLEILLHKKDAIPEDGHPKQDHPFRAKFIDFKLIVPQYPSIEQSIVCSKQSNLFFPIYQFYHCNFSTEINPPPPKA